MLKTFKILALLEGISYILLLFVGVPLKYWGGNDIMVRSLGMPHGLLFVAYVVLAIALKEPQKWNLKEFFIILIASIIPFGTFYIDYKYLKTKKEVA